MRTPTCDLRLVLVVCCAIPCADVAWGQTLIHNVDELQAMQNNLGGDYVLANDIDGSATASWNGGAGFEPVGTFTGSFDGNGHRIVGLTIYRPTTSSVGLFGRTQGATIQNVGLVGGSIRGENRVGAVAANGGVSYCYNTGTVTGEEAVGGIVGNGWGVSYCYNTGSVSGTMWTGGIAGTGAVTYSYNTGTIQSGQSAGGIVGGADDPQATNCYNVGTIVAINSIAGGIIGQGNHSYYGHVDLCYNAGSVSAPNHAYPIGEYAVNVANSYFDAAASLPATGSGGTGRTTGQMFEQSTYSGWDFATVWAIVEDSGYPYLQALGNHAEGVDFGDAPDPTYPTLLASSGARHIIEGDLRLGAIVDDEVDGQPTSEADGDDVSDDNDDDGVVFVGNLFADSDVDVSVTASGAGLLSAWVDFNADGDWDDAGEQVFADTPLSPGLNTLEIAVPLAAAPGGTFARFRVSTDSGLAPTGLASDGEVEDYAVTLFEPAHPADIDRDGVVSAIDVQLVINAALGLW